MARTCGFAERRMRNAPAVPTGKLVRNKKEGSIPDFAVATLINLAGRLMLNMLLGMTFLASAGKKQH